MITTEQRANLPELLRDIVDIDRDMADLARSSDLADVVTFRALRDRRAELREAAHRIYGSAPIRGENGPGRPTAMAA